MLNVSKKREKYISVFYQNTATFVKFMLNISKERNIYKCFLSKHLKIVFFYVKDVFLSKHFTLEKLQRFF